MEQPRRRPRRRPRSLRVRNSQVRQRDEDNICCDGGSVCELPDRTGVNPGRNDLARSAEFHDQLQENARRSGDCYWVIDSYCDEASERETYFVCR